MKPRQRSTSRGSCPLVTATLIAARRRLLDDDNLTGGFKPLRDAIALWLGVDDGDPRVAWECRQIVGEPGTIVKISENERST